MQSGCCGNLIESQPEHWVGRGRCLDVDGNFWGIKSTEVYACGFHGNVKLARDAEYAGMNSVI